MSDATHQHPSAVICDAWREWIATQPEAVCSFDVFRAFCTGWASAEHEIFQQLPKRLLNPN